MTATDFKLIPSAVLHPHEETVLRRIDSLPVRYVKSLLDEPEIRYAFLYYALLTHWPGLLGGDFAVEDLLANRLYWFLRLAKQYERTHDIDAGLQQQAHQLMESAAHELGAETVLEVEEAVLAELATNEKEIAVAYSDFSISRVKAQFGMILDEAGDFFAAVAPVAISDLLSETLKETIPLGLALSTEKARSEMIVAPVLLEVRRQLGNKVSLFSGIEWDVDDAQGLRGRCDFLMGLTSEQLTIEAPVLTVVEVKNDNTNAGIAQCLAEMAAARIFNEQNNAPVSTVFGVVTTGSNWRFLRLVKSTAFVDVSEYHIKEVERIVGIIVSMFTSSGVTKKA